MHPTTPNVDRSSWTFPVPVGVGDSGAPHGTPVTLPNARLFSHNGVVIDSNNRLVADLSPDFRPPPSGHRILDYTGLPDPQPVDARVLALATPASWKNYFHWIINALPRLRGLDLTTFDHVFTPLSRPCHRESLEALGIPPERRLEALVDSHFRCRELTAVSPLPIGGIDLDGVAFLRDLFGAAPAAPGRRLYLSRADAWRRRVLNEDELQPVLAAAGFEVVTLGGRTIREQAALFAGASAVVAPHGAALTNLLFAPPGCRVLELFPDNLHSPHFEKLSSTCGHRYASHASPAENLDGDFHLDPGHVPALLEQLLG